MGMEVAFSVDDKFQGQDHPPPGRFRGHPLACSYPTKTRSALHTFYSPRMPATCCADSWPLRPTFVPLPSEIGSVLALLTSQGLTLKTLGRLVKSTAGTLDSSAKPVGAAPYPQQLSSRKGQASDFLEKLTAGFAEVHNSNQAKADSLAGTGRGQSGLLLITDRT